MATVTWLATNGAVFGLSGNASVQSPPTGRNAAPALTEPETTLMANATYVLPAESMATERLSVLPRRRDELDRAPIGERVAPRGEDRATRVVARHGVAGVVDRDVRILQGLRPLDAELLVVRPRSGRARAIPEHHVVVAGQAGEDGVARRTDGQVVHVHRFGRVQQRGVQHFDGRRRRRREPGRDARDRRVQGAAVAGRPRGRHVAGPVHPDVHRDAVGADPDLHRRRPRGARALASDHHAAAVAAVPPAGCGITRGAEGDVRIVERLQARVRDRRRPLPDGGAGERRDEQAGERRKRDGEGGATSSQRTTPSWP